jgi:hypothetical protein
MLVFLRPALCCGPLRFLLWPFLVELLPSLVAATPVEVVAISAAPSSRVSARKVERIVFMHYQCTSATKIRSKITMEFPI